jgi:hypothetical protein
LDEAKDVVFPKIISFETFNQANGTAPPPMEFSVAEVSYSLVSATTLVNYHYTCKFHFNIHTTAAHLTKQNTHST